MKRLPWCIALSVLALASIQAQAAIKVGDSVSSVSYKAANGGDISIAALKGKLVLIDFWATWCKPCMAEAPHMVSINEKYKTKGLVLLGISLDQEAAGMLQVAKTANLNWPQVIDGGKFSAMFGVDSIPRTFLVGPDGNVLWTGHPGSGLDAAIDDAFKNHPPFLVDPAIVADASKVLDEIEQKLGSKDARGAVKLLARIPANASLDQKFADRSKDVHKKLEDAAEGLLAAAGALAQAGNYPEAIKSLRELADGLTGLDVAVKAKKQLADLLGKPEVKAAVAKADQDKRDADREALANVGLTVARKLQADGKHALAYARFKQVAADFAGTPSAATAAEQVKVYNKEHPEFAQGEKDAVVGIKAKAALSMAETYKNSGNYELAKAKYRSVIATYPNTEYAETAKQELQRMGQ